MSDPVPRISIVIATRNRREDLVATLVRLFAEQTPSREVVVVDNGSLDGTSAVVSELFPQVTLISLSENRGHTGGQNTGVSVARGEYIVLLDDDSFPKPGALATACEFWDRNPLVGALAANVFNPRTDFWEMSRFFETIPTEPADVPWYVGCG